MVKQRDFCEHMHKRWTTLGIEALIVPPYPITAFKSVNAEHVGNFNDYLTCFTLTHYPLGIVPVTEV